MGNSFCQVRNDLDHDATVQTYNGSDILFGQPFDEVKLLSGEARFVEAMPDFRGPKVLCGSTWAWVANGETITLSWLEAHGESIVEDGWMPGVPNGDAELEATDVYAESDVLWADEGWDEHAPRVGALPPSSTSPGKTPVSFSSGAPKEPSSELLQSYLEHEPQEVVLGEFHATSAVAAVDTCTASSVADSFFAGADLRTSHEVDKAEVVTASDSANLSAEEGELRSSHEAESDAFPSEPDALTPRSEAPQPGGVETCGPVVR